MSSAEKPGHPSSPAPSGAARVDTRDNTSSPAGPSARSYAGPFCDRSVVEAYATRPPYPARVFHELRALLPAQGCRVLELGCGTGDLTYGLAPHVHELVAVESSPAMLSAAIRRQPSVPRQVRFVLAPAEAFEPREKFSLVVAADSMQWMDWAKLLPKSTRWLKHDGWLALVTARSLVVPWAAALDELLARFASTAPDVPSFAREQRERALVPTDLVDTLQQRGWFVEHGRAHAVEPAFCQSVDAYVESFHALDGFSRERMSAQTAAAFDDALRTLVHSHLDSGAATRHPPHGTSDTVSGDVAATVVWGRPTG